MRPVFMRCAVKSPQSLIYQWLALSLFSFYFPPPKKGTLVLSGVSPDFLIFWRASHWAGVCLSLKAINELQDRLIQTHSSIHYNRGLVLRLTRARATEKSSFIAETVKGVLSWKNNRSVRRKVKTQVVFLKPFSPRLLRSDRKHVTWRHALLFCLRVTGSRRIPPCTFDCV